LSYTVTISATPGGSVSPVGTFTKYVGQTVAITATPDSGYKWSGWIMQINGAPYSSTGRGNPTNFSSSTAGSEWLIFPVFSAVAPPPPVGDPDVYAETYRGVMIWEYTPSSTYHFSYGGIAYSNFASLSAARVKVDALLYVAPPPPVEPPPTPPPVEPPPVEPPPVEPPPPPAGGFTLTVLNSVDNTPISGAGVFFTSLTDPGVVFTANTNSGGVATIFRVPPVAYEEYFDIAILKDGFYPYSLTSVKWSVTSATFKMDSLVDLPPEWVLVETYKGAGIYSDGVSFRATYKTVALGSATLEGVKLLIDEVDARPTPSVLDRFMGFKELPTLQRLMVGGLVFGGMAALFKASFPAKKIKEMTEK
jgi:hypothetical protein